MKTQQQQAIEIKAISEKPTHVFFSEDGFVLVQKTAETDTKKRDLICEHFTAEEITLIEKITKKKYWVIGFHTYQYDHSNKVKTEIYMHTLTQENI